MKSKIRTIDLQAKKWFDKVNGNSYFSAQMTINYGLKSERIIYIPFQYGYGSQYESTAARKLRRINRKEIKQLPEYYALWSICKELNITLRKSMQENCKKRDVISYGTPPKE